MMRYLLLIFILAGSTVYVLGQTDSKTNVQPASLRPSKSNGEVTPGASNRKRNSPPKKQQARQEASNQGTPKSTSKTAVDKSETTEKTAKSVAVVKKDAPKVEKIQWLTLEQAVEKCKTEPRKIYIDVYIDACGWCKRMEETTFSESYIAAYLNQNYYAVRFNAEQREDIVFKGKTYKFEKVGSRGYHQLAAEFLNNRMSYPTNVFLNENLDLIQPLAGYLEPMKFETILYYFGTDSYKRTPWESYERNFVSNRH